MICSECGTKLKKDSKFCSNCGGVIEVARSVNTRGNTKDKSKEIKTDVSIKAKQPEEFDPRFNKEKKVTNNIIKREVSFWDKVITMFIAAILGSIVYVVLKLAGLSGVLIQIGTYILAYYFIKNIRSMIGKRNKKIINK